MLFGRPRISPSQWADDNHDIGDGILQNWRSMTCSLLYMILKFSSTSIHMVEHLYICGNRYRWEDNYTENMQWLDVFRPFTAVKNLYVSKD
jgi:hypothetical protein